MPTHPTHNVNATDDLAAQFKRFHQRISSLERASSSGLGQGDVDARVIAVGDPRWVNVTGDSMSGALTMNGGGPSIVLNGAGNYLAWFNGATRMGYLQGNAGGMLLNSETGRLGLYGVDGVTMTPFKINGYAASASSGANRIVLTDANGYIWVNYINMTSNFDGGLASWLVGMSAGDNYLRWFNNFKVGGQVGSTYWASTAYYSGAFFADVGTQYAQYGMHPGGVAGSMRMANNFMVVSMVDVGGTAYVPIYASAFTVNSTRKHKQDIEPWPVKVNSLGAAANTLTALGLVRELEVVSFRRRFDEYIREAYPTVRRAEAWERLNQYRAHRGLELYPKKLHDCDTGTCRGTNENPCPWYRNWEQPHLGLIVEDVVDVAPELIWLEEDGEPGGIDVNAYVALIHAAMKELDQRVNELENR